MDKHIQLAGVLNIVYRSISLLVGLLLFVLAATFWEIFDYLVRIGAVEPHEIPMELMSLIPIIISCVAILVTLISILGIVGGAAVLKRKEWGRILLLVVSFFNLMRIPLGTLLGIYTLWVLLNADVIKAFSPAPKAVA